MFTNDNNSRNRHAAAAAIFAAAIVALPTQGFSAPKRDVGHGKWNQTEVLEGRYGHPSNPQDGTGDTTIRFGEMKKKDQSFAKDPKVPTEGRYGHPSNPPDGTGDTTIRFGEMKKKDQSFAKDPKVPTEGRYGHPSNPPDGTGDTTIRFGEMKKKDMNFVHEPRTVVIGRQSHPSNPPDAGGDTTIRSDAMQTDGAAQTGSSATRTTSPAFIRSLDLSSGGRWVGGASSYSPARNPFTDGRAWVSLTRDGGNNLVATAGMSFLLK